MFRQYSLIILFWLLGLPLAAADAQQPQIEFEIKGDTPEMDNTLRAHLKLASLECAAPEWRIKAALRDAPAQIGKALQAFGYYRANVKPHYQSADSCWSVRIDIDPGPVVRLRSVSIQLEGDGTDDDTLNAIVARTPLIPEAPLRHRTYENFKRRLSQGASAGGYLDHRWLERRLLVDPALGQADVVLRLDTGPLHRIGELRVSESPFDERLVAGFNPLEEGQPLSSPALIEADRKLSESGYFSDVEVRPLLDESDEDDVPVEVRLKTRKRHSYRFGAGIDSDTGMRFSTAYANRYLNARGHRLFGELSLSTKLSSLQSKYEIPILSDPANQIVSFTGAMFRERTDVVNSDRMELVAAYRYPRGNWREEPFLKVLAERSSAGDEEEKTGTLHVLPGIRWDTSYFDDPIDTRRAHKLGLVVQGAHDAFLSDASFAQVIANAGLVRSRPGGIRFIGRAELGMTIGDTGLELPTSLRFFAGGDRSVRGYGYQRLAPRDALGEPRGGSFMSTLSLELDYPVWGDWYGALFVDAGNAADSLDNALDMETAFGVGVRWLTPVGRVRVDLAVPQNKFDDDYRIHFGIGAEL